MTTTSGKTDGGGRPLVSVCMITWNHRFYVEQAIESVMSQVAPFEIELIIGDDCSTDGTSKIVNAMAEKYGSRVLVLRGSENVGMHENADRCFLAARGRYIAICEGDDYWHDPAKLRDQIAILEQNPGMALCHSDFDRLTRLGRGQARHRSQRGPVPVGHAYRYLLHAWGVMSATAVYRTEILQRFSGSTFDNRKWPFGDYNRLLFASVHGTFGYLDRSTATFRKVSGSAGNKGANSALRIQLSNKECVDAFMDAWPVDELTKFSVHMESWKRIYTAAFWAGDIETLDRAAGHLPTDSSVLSRTRHLVRRTVLMQAPLFRVIRGTRDFLTVRLSALPR